jgi:Protein of unknown function (DUF3631)
MASRRRDKADLLSRLSHGTRTETRSPGKPWKSYVSPETLCGTKAITVPLSRPVPRKGGGGTVAETENEINSSDSVSVRGSDPSLPEELHDRAADNWHPLLAIADHAGAEWPAKGRRAALELSGTNVGEADTTHTLLLADIRN